MTLIKDAKRDMAVVQVEAFETPLHGLQIRWYVGHSFFPEAPQFPPGFREQISTESPPFQRRILISAQSSSEAWKLLDRWDAVFLPQSSTDWSLILTWLQHQPRTTLVIVCPEVQIPPAFVEKSRQGPRPTVIHFQRLAGPPPLTPPHTDVDAVFFPPLSEDSLDITQQCLQHYVPDVLKTLVLKEVVRDLKGAGASLAVLLDRQDRRGFLEWYYVTKTVPKPNPLLGIVQALLSRE